MNRAVFHEQDREKIIDKMEELGLKAPFERFRYGGQWYLAVQTSNPALYYYCKGLLKKEEQDFFY